MPAFQLRGRILLTLLLFAVMMTQTASSVCGAQCVSHAAPAGNVPAMAHCHSMMKAQPQAAKLEECGASRAFCPVELPADVQAKSLIIASLPVGHSNLLSHPGVARSPQSSRSPRSRAGGSSLITALRI